MQGPVEDRPVLVVTVGVWLSPSIPRRQPHLELVNMLLFYRYRMVSEGRNSKKGNMLLVGSPGENLKKKAPKKETNAALTSKG